ncbi:sigma-70 family RNA polymerase sigma factor [Rhodospirillum centenum]|uniref:RNA polymerase sigma-70 factor ECF family protein n=1 Tax=Rhodospirillum centenum (strain ATCC 51521 / SW) TaxID=414684 RepID=B6IQH4_RHOCS|nr:sigma-70 family RNA polymerase sigma factor [Rhodospirillum centenum]ACI97710.1 RNA polymerase sigma-70 factor; ECF family protein [Rhodospirillum centenum SW]
MPSNPFEDQLAEQIAALRRYALVLTRSRTEAEDLVQDCLAKALSCADQWQPGTDLRAWLFRILYTCHVSLLRKQQVRARAQQGEVPETSADPEQPRRLEVKRVLSALDRLPAAQREAIVLVALEDMKYEDAARRLGIPVGTLMSRLARGREALRRLMDEGVRPRLRLVGGKS